MSHVACASASINSHVNSVLSEGTVHRPQELLLGETCCILWLWVLKRSGVWQAYFTFDYSLLQCDNHVNRASARRKHILCHSRPDRYVERPHSV